MTDTVAFGRALRRYRYALLLVSVVTLHFLHDGFSMVGVKLNHPRQYLVKLTSWVNIDRQMPDLTGPDPQTDNIPGICPKRPPELSSELHVGDESLQDTTELKDKYIPYQPGGHFRPSNCISRTKTAVIIPYRKRERHLAVLLNHLIPFLFRQQAEFAIFIVEPVEGVTFNRALLLNVGFLEALKSNNFTCFIFHDVDRIPESDLNLYRCGDSARHMLVAPSEYQYSLPYYRFGGGIVGMSRRMYEDINGHSNLFFGWGGEDDDLLNRIAWKGHKITRYPQEIGRYTTILHHRDKGNSISNCRYQLMWTSEKRMDTEGLNSLTYHVVKKELRQLYTWVLIDIDMKPYRRAIEEFT